MPDDIQLQDSAGITSEIALDALQTLNGVDVSAIGPKAQRMKIVAGDDGVGQDVSSAHPLPVVADTELTTADLDTGAGTDTRAVVGLARAESGGAVLVGSGNPLPVSGTVTVGSAPAAARTTDSISVAVATDAIMNGTTAIAPLFAPITASASGATTIVAAITSKKIRVLAYTLVCAGGVTVKWQSHTTTAQATGGMPFGANGGTSVPFCPVGHFETVAGEALDLNLSGAIVVGGHVTYIPV